MGYSRRTLLAGAAAGTAGGMGLVPAGRSQPAAATTTAAPPVHYRIPTSSPVAFIAIHDGYGRDDSALDYVLTNKLPVNPFITYYAVTSVCCGTTSAMTDQARWVGQFLSGHAPGSHSKQHVDLSVLSYTDQQAQIASGVAWLGSLYGKTVTHFAPPYGYYNMDTRPLLAQSGITAMVQWTHEVDVPNSRIVPKWGYESLMPGDVILTHFTADLGAQLAIAHQAITSAHLIPAYLDDYV